MQEGGLCSPFSSSPLLFFIRLLTRGDSSPTAHSRSDAKPSNKKETEAHLDDWLKSMDDHLVACGSLGPHLPVETKHFFYNSQVPYPVGST